jgi:TP901 family phage tail tape measure protein
MDNSVKFRIELETNGEKVLKTLQVNTDDFKESVAMAVGETKKLTDGFSKMAQASVIATSVISVVNGLNQAVSTLAENYDSFDEAMRAANTMAGLDPAGFEKLTNQVKDLSKQLPIAREELANGLYQVISNGVPEDNWIEFLNKSARASVGGIADLGETVTVTSTIIKNYGLEWSAAGDIQDKIQMTAKNGVTSFEQLAQALPRVTGSAATLGVTIDELFASFATLTGVTGNTAEVSTQLAAVFTALVKPSSEATTMAQQMGIQFDAAAIKAAGGMRNFLQQLDSDIKSYAAAHGKLDQEIYGKLFGSAESLRALTSLTGELSDKFGENVEAMSGSMGTIDAAVDNVAGSAKSLRQIISNNVSAFGEFATKIASSVSPVLSVVAATTQFAMSLYMLKTPISTCIGRITAFGTASVATTGAVRTLTVATVTLRAVMGGVLVAAIGVVIGVVSSLITKEEKAADKTDALADSMEAFKNASASAQAEISMECEKLKDLIKSKGDATDIISQLNQKYGQEFGYHSQASEWYDILTRKSEAYCRQIAYEAKARDLAFKIGQNQVQLDTVNRKKAELEKNGNDKQQRVELVTKWNSAGQKTLGWQKVIRDTQEYANLKDEANQLTGEIKTLQDELANSLNMAKESQQEIADSAQTATQAVNWETMSYTDLKQAIEKQTAVAQGKAGTKDLEGAKKENDLLTKMVARKNALDKQYNYGSSSSNEFDGKKLIANATSYLALGNNVKYYQAQIEKTNKSEADKIARLTKLRDEAQKSQDAVKRLYEEMGRPTSFDSLEDFDKELTYLQDQRATATQEELGGLDAQIRRVTDLKTAFEQGSHVGIGIDDVENIQQAETELSYWEQRIRQVSGTEQTEAVKVRDVWKEKVRVMNEGTTIPVPVADLSNLQEATDAISYYEQKILHAGETESLEIQQRINEYKKWKKERENALKTASKPANLSQLKTVGELTEAISWYTDSMQTQSDVEIEATQRTIIALEKKRDVLQRLAAIPKMQSELDDLSSLSGHKLTIELEAIGVDSIRDKIRSLQKLLDDTKNPLGEDQRKEVQKQVSAWKSYEKQLKRSQIRVQDVWGSIKGVGGSIENMTDALKGNTNAWKKITAVIDGMMSLYENFSSIISIIGLFTKASEGHAAAKVVEAGAEETEAGATAASAATSVVASTTTTAALIEETAAWSALAAAKTFAAHAEIPFAGTEIASGFIAQQQAIIAAAAIPKFAKGAVLYGPTLGIMGEYSNAANNPEVVAPLNKLKDLIQPTGGMGGTVEFRIRRRELVGVLKQDERIQMRTR